MTTAADPMTAGTTVIAGFPAERIAIDLGRGRVWLWTVTDLERLVDRGALLRGEAEPPYWAHLWSGARVMARYLVDWTSVRDRDVLEIGCGLGLPGVVAATLGGRVTGVDARAEPLEFVAASAAANAVACATRRDDFLRLDADLRCDVLLAAEVAYDRERFADLAAVFDRHLRADGIGVMTDGYRTDTRPLYGALAARGLATHAIDVRVPDEGRGAAVRVTLIRRLP
jgi:predicted nicotinamide N-methyase